MRDEGKPELPSIVHTKKLCWPRCVNDYGTKLLRMRISLYVSFVRTKCYFKLIVCLRSLV